MKIKEFLKTTPESLAAEQHAALKCAAIDRLNEVIAYLMNDEYDKLEQCLAYSPAGDGMGCDNEYIDFSNIYGDDISDVVGKLIELNKLKGDN